MPGHSRVVVTDYTFESLDVEAAILEPLGCQVEGAQCRTAAQVAELVADADYVITQFAPVTHQAIAAMHKARIIVRYGIGVDNVDLSAATQHGIPVCNVPNYCIDEVADHTLALILAATRRLDQNNRVIEQGGWKLAVPVDAMRALSGSTAGVVGFGRIGRGVVQRLRGFGGRVLVHDPMVDGQDIKQAGAIPATLAELLAASDLITLHCPSVPATRQMINEHSLASMKPGVIVINVGRGTLIDTPALTQALRRGHVAAAALDVADPEPLPTDHPLRQMSNVILTAHIASVSPAAVRRLRESAAQAVACACRGLPLPNVVNGVKPAPAPVVRP